MAHRELIKTQARIYYEFSDHAEFRDLIHRIEELRPIEARRPQNLPYESIAGLFVGRDAMLAQVRQRFSMTAGKAVGITPRHALHGLGGVGKTRLAVEYAWRYAGEYTALFFLRVSAPESLQRELATLSEPRLLYLHEHSQPKLRADAVTRWLAQHPGWLLILDNVHTSEAAAAVEAFLPQVPGGHVLITSRLSDWSASVRPIELDVLKLEPAGVFLLARTDGRRKPGKDDAEQAALLAGELDGLALALEQAAAYIAKKKLSIGAYRQRWKEQRDSMMSWHDARLMQYPLSIAATWETSFAQLSEEERWLLWKLAWLAPDPIPVTLLPADSDQDLLAGLESYSLVRSTPGDGTFSIHRLVQDVTRQRIPPEDRPTALKAIEILLAHALPDTEWSERGWDLWEQFAPHCEALLVNLRDDAAELPATQIMAALGVWYMRRAQEHEAERHLRRAVKLLPPQENHAHGRGHRTQR